MASLLKHLGKDSTPKLGPTCVSGSCAEQGRRSTMEDTHVNMDAAGEKFGFAKEMTVSFYAVYDGHGGRHAADLAATYLHECVLRSEKFKNKDISDDEVLQVMRESFIRTDDIIMKKSMEGMWNDGCTVVALLLINKKLYIGNLGDAEAVLARKKDAKDPAPTAELLTMKHKPNDPDERKRIEDAGGHVVFGRVLGSLAVSRAFGDSEFKAPRNRQPTHFVSNDPYLKVVSVDPNVPFMIIACDGLWDKVTYQDAVNFVAQRHKAKVSPKDAAAQLVEKALKDGTLDNVSVIIVYFSW